LSRFPSFSTLENGMKVPDLWFPEVVSGGSFISTAPRIRPLGKSSLQMTKLLISGPVEIFLDVSPPFSAPVQFREGSSRIAAQLPAKLLSIRIFIGWYSALQSFLELVPVSR
jgi:hypothetical protein